MADHNHSDDRLVPVVSWEIGVIPSRQIVVFRPHLHDEGISEAVVTQPAVYHALSLKQAQRLRDDLDEALDNLRNEAVPGHPSKNSKH
ncbi:MAG: hypothetical protein ACRETO_01330 [Gammaproteobacteria bacterium]